MQCPVCKTVNLMMTDRQGIEIDYCPQCRGVWLDRGELDKIIDRSAGIPAAGAPAASPQPAAYAPPPPQPSYPKQSYPQQSYPQGQHHHGHGHHPHHYKKKREGFLSDLFDFD